MNPEERPEAIKAATPDYPINELASRRWSPFSFSPEMVSETDLRSLFEAARWAPSCFNEQPWRYIVATKDDKNDFKRLLSCLTEGNQKWAKYAPVLALGVISKSFKRNGKPNRHAEHDLGLASATLVHEATARGIYVHQMAGILPQKAKQLFAIPDDFEVLTGIAIGYAGENDEAEPGFKERDRRKRNRRPASETVFSGEWGQTHSLFR
jgi:nitroreductase